MNSLSKTERANLLILAALVSAVSLANILAVSLNKETNPLPYGMYDMARASVMPFGRLLSIFIFPFVLFSRKYIVSLVFTAFCFLPFIREFIASYVAIIVDREIYLNYSVLRLLYLIANPLDYLTTFLIITLIHWQLSIIVRRYVDRGTPV
jgi:hypothetical protein